MSALAHLWRHHRIALIAFVAAAGVTLFFAVRMAVFTLYWADPRHHEQPLAGWMTLHYVAHSWHVPPDAVIAGAGVGAPDDRPRRARSLAEIARDEGVPLSTLIARLQKAIADARATGQ